MFMVPRTRDFEKGEFVVRVDVLQNKSRSQNYRRGFHRARDSEAISQRQGTTIGIPTKTKWGMFMIPKTHGFEKENV